MQATHSESDEYDKALQEVGEQHNEPADILERASKCTVEQSPAAASRKNGSRTCTTAREGAKNALRNASQ